MRASLKSTSFDLSGQPPTEITEQINILGERGPLRVWKKCCERLLDVPHLRGENTSAPNQPTVQCPTHKKKAAFPLTGKQPFRRILCIYPNYLLCRYVLHCLDAKRHCPSLKFLLVGRPDGRFLKLLLCDLFQLQRVSFLPRAEFRFLL